MKKLLLLFFLPIGFAASAQQWSDTVSKIEAIFSQYRPENPGCMVSISRNGQVIYSKAWGMADLEHGVPLTVNSITEAGSVSKQFTAAAILLLEQQGKLSTNDDVHKYIPELPDYGAPILLRYLLHHSSGIRDWGAVATIAGWPRGTKAYSNDDALDIIVHQKALNHSPNEYFSYSNSNYNLLAIIVQRVSGMSLAEYTRNYIFEPAGMTHTQWRDDYRRVVPGRAIAYNKPRNGPYKTDMPNENAYGNGGLLTTTEDLDKWSEFYGSGRLGGASLLHKQLTTETLSTGRPNEYGAGLFLGKLWGWDWINHTGATAGYRAFLESFPQLHLSIAWLSNTSEFDGGRLMRMLNDLFVPKKEPEPSRTIVTDGDGTLLFIPQKHKHSDYTGYYYSDEAQAGFTIVEKENKLWMVRSSGKAESIIVNGDESALGPNALFDGDGGTRLSFLWEKETVTGLTVSNERAKKVLFIRQK